MKGNHLDGRQRSALLFSAVVAGSLLFGVLVSSLCLFVAWKNGGSTELQSDQASWTWLQFGLIFDAEDNYEKTYGHPAPSLKELDNREDFVTSHGFYYGLVDAWRHPFHYSVHGETYRLVSYGADDKPGGKGDNADISSTGPDDPPVSFHAFLTSDAPELSLIVSVCVVAGVVSACLALFLFSRTDPLPPRSWAIVKPLVITLLASLIVSAVMALLNTGEQGTM